jgi:hypothetical protein
VEVEVVVEDPIVDGIVVEDAVAADAVVGSFRYFVEDAY